MSDSTCRRCNAPIVFVTSAKSGKPIPCDPTPVRIVPVSKEDARAIRHIPLISGVNDDGAVVRGVEATADSPAAAVVAVRISHFGTCPHAAEFRKPKGPK